MPDPDQRRTESSSDPHALGSAHSRPVVLHELAREQSAGPPTRGWASGELARVLPEFRIPAPTAARTLARGDPNTPKALIETHHTRYVLKRRAPGKADPYRVAFGHRLMLGLRARGLPVPALIGTVAENNSMLQRRGHVYEMTEFIDGEPFDASGAACADAGRMLAVVHLALQDLGPAQRSTGTDSDTPGSARLDGDRVGRALDRALRVVGGPVEPLIEHHRRIGSSDHASILDRSPVQLIHNDWHPGNLVFRGSAVAGILDLDAACRGPAARDVGMGLVQFALEAGPRGGPWAVTLDRARMRAFWNGYVLGSRPLDHSDPGSADPSAERTSVPGNWTPELVGAMPAAMAQSILAEVAFSLSATGRLGAIPGPEACLAIDALLTSLPDHADALNEPPGPTGATEPSDPEIHG